MKHILITGTGFIMSRFIEMFHKEFKISVIDKFSHYASQNKRVDGLKNVEIFDADVSDQDQVLDVFKSIEPVDLLIHAAAETHVDNSIRFPGDFVQTNVIGTYNILEMAKEFSVGHTIYISTDEVLEHKQPNKFREHRISDCPCLCKPFGDPANDPDWKKLYDSYSNKADFPNGKLLTKFPEEPLIYLQFNRIREKEMSPSHLNPIFNPSSPYSASKASAEMLCMAYKKTYKMPITVIRPCNNYGPGQHKEKLIPKVIDKASRDEKIPVFVSTAYRDWLYVDDCCRGIRMILEQAPGDTYHISAYDEKETREVVEEILRVMGKPRSLIEEVPDRAGYDLVYSIDSRNLRSLGWKPEVSFREGIECILNQST